jgi:hypothetical protein
MSIGTSELVPSWTKPGSWSLGRDPLGIQATSVRMYRTLVPGLTNVTNRLRYYSYYCWVVALWAKIRHADDELEWRLFIRRAEALYALACESFEADTRGLAGSEWARQHWAELADTKIDLRPHTNRPGESGQYLKAKRGNFGQFYVASMLDVRLLGDSKRIPIVAKAGQDLADAFAASIGEPMARQLAAAVNSGELSKVALVKIGKAIHPSRLNGNSREMKLLRSFLWPKTSEVPGSEARKTSAWLLLDLARKGVSIFDETALRRAFYQRRLPDGRVYMAEGTIIDRWRAFHANELCHIALEALLNGMTSALMRQVDGVEPAKLVNDLVKASIPSNERKIPWAEWAVAATGGLPDAEDALSSEVLDGLKRFGERAEDPKVLLAAAKLLGILWNRWNRVEQHVKIEIARYSVRSGTSLSGVLFTLKDAGTQTITEALAAVVRRHVIAEHLVIAGRKIALSGKYTYRFVIEDGVLSDGVVAEYGYTNPRLRNLATFLTDAKLVDVAGRITPKGLGLLNEFQPA